PPSGNLIFGNFIGTDATGSNSLGNSNHGIYMTGGNGNSIGGTVNGAGNRIAFNSVGLAIAFGGGTNNAIRSNLIYSNANLGIGLNFDSVVGNDPGDFDTGANQLQNFPVITNAIISPASTIIQGTLNSQPNTTY